MTYSIHYSHDNFFKASMIPQIVKCFLAAHVPPYRWALLEVNPDNFNGLTMVDGNFQDSDHRELRSDVAYRCYSHKGLSRIFLIEAQASPDPKITVRMAKYTLSLQEKEANNREDGSMPIVHPICFYHGNKHWNLIPTLESHYGEDPGIIEQLGALRGQIQFINLSKMDDETLKSHDNAALFQLLLKPRKNIDELLKLIREIVKSDILVETFEEVGINYAEDVFKYILSRNYGNNPEIRREVIALLKGARINLKNETGEEIMSSITSQIMKEGVQRGELRMLVEMTQKMVGNGVSWDVIRLITAKISSQKDLTEREQELEAMEAQRLYDDGDSTSDGEEISQQIENTQVLPGRVSMFSLGHKM